VTQQIDLDDLPPRVAQTLERLAPGEDLVLVRRGLVVATLAAQAKIAAAVPADAPPAADDMEEILDQFNAMIHDEF